MLLNDGDALAQGYVNLELSSSSRFSRRGYTTLLCSLGAAEWLCNGYAVF